MLHISLVLLAYLRVPGRYCIAIRFNLTIDFFRISHPHRIAIEVCHSINICCLRTHLPIINIIIHSTSFSVLSVWLLSSFPTVLLPHAIPGRILLCPYQSSCTSAKGFAFQAPNNIIFYRPHDTSEESDKIDKDVLLVLFACD